MAKEVDTNSFWYIKHNPISKVGVFPYYGRNISDECEPDKIYNVYRPAETLKQSVPTWDNPPKPFIEDHEMLGEGFTAIDDRPVQGIIYNPVFDEQAGVLYADLAIYSEEMKNKIADGKKEISLGYFCKYKKEPGVYKGMVYDFVQTDMVGNHGALVDAGRCGSDVKVFDSKCTMDSIDINPTDFEAKNGETGFLLNKNQENEKINTNKDLTKEERGTDMADKREAIREIMAIAAKPNSDFEGGEEEKERTIAKILEKSEYAKSEAGTSNDEGVEEEKKEEKAADKCAKDKKMRKGKDEDPEEEKKADAEDEDEEEQKKSEDDENLSASDVMAFLRSINERLENVLNRKATDEDPESEEKKADAEDEDEEAEDEDEDDDKKSNATDSALFTLGHRTAQDATIAGDKGLQKYMAD